MASKTGKEPAVQPEAQNPRDARRDGIPASCLVAHFYIGAEVHVFPSHK